MEKVHCWAGRAESWKKRCPHQPVCSGCAWGQSEDICAAWTLGSGVFSSSPAVSYKHWTQSEPSVIKGNSLHTQEQLSNGCLVPGLERSAGHLLSVPPLTTGHSALNLELCESPAATWGEALGRVLGASKNTQKMHWEAAGSYLLCHAMAVYFWCKLWAAWEFRHAGCAQWSPHMTPALTFTHWESASEYFCRVNRGYSHLPALSEDVQ